MAHILVSCDGVPVSAGAEAATDITAEFKEHRTWWSHVQCTWDGKRLLLHADGESGDALMDEFSDCLSAYISKPFSGTLRLESISPQASA